MSNLTFFAKPPFNKIAGSYLMRGSSAIRAIQIAEYLGAKYNPTSGFEDDICIYVKPGVNYKSVEFWNPMVDKSYIDVVDGDGLVGCLKKYPTFSVIAASQLSYDYMKERLQNNIILIPQQHCNSDRIKRNRKEITTVGIIGTPGHFMYPIEDIRERLKQIGLKLVINTLFQNRQDVVDFYKQIDVQIDWYTKKRPFKMPLKLTNAASFGIPTVAYDQKSYKEFDGCYIPVKTIDQLIAEVEKLKNQEYYDNFANKIIVEAEKYHISNIAELYKKLVK